MPYREKTAWLSLVSMAIAFIPYFSFVAVRSRAEVTNLHVFALFAAAVVVQIAVMIAGHIFLRLQSPEDATTPPDERDRAITSRSITCAYYVLITGMVLMGWVMPFNSGGWTIINAALLMIVAAEVVRYGVAVFSYWRQS